ncbi:MAG: hypothetical protein L0210_02905 [Rhodospirillales bacterium]|nr:hypothetical protein [Rhodospirillales bacterium]
MTPDSSNLLSPDTLVVHAGFLPADQKSAANPPVCHASTVLFPAVAADRETGFARLAAAPGGSA